jgi:hypothetical protein
MIFCPAGMQSNSTETGRYFNQLVSAVSLEEIPEKSGKG